MDKHKIVLQTGPTKGRRVLAKTTRQPESDDEDYREGNVDTPEGTTIRWYAKNEAHVTRFTVKFIRLSDGAATWPFVEKEDGQGTAPDDYVGPLTLNPGQRVSLTTKGGNEQFVKYEVSAVSSGASTIDDCDPTIIIRPSSNELSRAVFGVICAVVGAVVGAVLARL
jgi:hypothetical protein